jgi:hypothetical protein
MKYHEVGNTHLTICSFASAAIAVQNIYCFRKGAVSARLRLSQQGGSTSVDLTTKVATLATWAAIVFVGAIVVGAFSIQTQRDPSGIAPYQSSLK